MMGDMIDDIMSQIQNLLSDQKTEVVTKMKGQLTRAIFYIAKELVLSIVKQYSGQTCSRLRKIMDGSIDTDEDIFQ